MATNPFEPLQEVNSVFVVQHVVREDRPDEDVKLIGVYSTETAAKAAIDQLRQEAGFRDWPDGFHIDEYRLDETQWRGGFG